MRALGVPDEAQASAVDARQELDLKVLRGDIGEYRGGIGELDLKVLRPRE